MILIHVSALHHFSTFDVNFKLFLHTEIFKHRGFAKKSMLMTPWKKKQEKQLNRSKRKYQGSKQLRNMYHHLSNNLRRGLHWRMNQYLTRIWVDVLHLIIPELTDKNSSSVIAPTKIILKLCDQSFSHLIYNVLLLLHIVEATKNRASKRS